MLGVDYFQLLKGLPCELSQSQWEEIVNSVAMSNPRNISHEFCADVIGNLLCETSDEWVTKRTTIVSGAAHSHANPTLRSRYCLSGLRNVVAEAWQEKTDRLVSPDRLLVHRQVQDHLRKLRVEGILCSFNRNAHNGKLVCVFWALKEWGPQAMDRRPTKSLEDVPDCLRVIRAYEGGKGVFDYAGVLPSYIPKALMEYGAPLSTAQISQAVEASITPPLARNPDEQDIVRFISPGSDRTSRALARNPDQLDGDLSPQDSASCSPLWPVVVSAEEQLQQAQIRTRFFNSLDPEERKVLDMKDDGESIEAIAGALGCSKRRVNNLWKTVIDKFTACSSE